MGEHRYIDSKVLAWYDFKENSRILYIGKKDDKLYKYLKDKKLQIDLEKGRKTYDYIIMINNYIEIDKLIENTEYLNEDGVLLIGFDNKYGISKFLSYDCENRVSALEKEDKQYTNIMQVKKMLKQYGFRYCNTYMPFPNLNRVGMISSDKIDNLSDKIDKYFVDYEDGMTILAREIDLLRNISTYNMELFNNIANSYLIELSKNEINTDVKYVSYNNYRKEEYQYATIIREKIVEKRPVGNKSINSIKKIGENQKYLKNYDVEILDKYIDNKLYSDFVKDRKTFDVELSMYADDEEKLINELQKYKEIFQKNSVKYNKDIRRHFIEPLKKESDEMLGELNYLEYAFYDMVPKNCFYIDDKYYFFDQEWMEKYLPVEFILYRSIINSYDLVRKIKVDPIFEKLGLLKYKELFEKIDIYLRNIVLDEEIFSKINKNYRKMYEEIYDKKVLEIQNNELRDKIKNQEQYIKELQEND